MAVLENCERRIEGYRQSRNEAAGALLEIYHLFENQDDEVIEYENFVEYCDQRWGFAKSYAYSLVDHGKFLLAYKGNGSSVPNEKQLRTLKAVQLSRPEKEQGVDVWQKRGHAWDAISEERGVDITPSDLKQELHQRRNIVPRKRQSVAEKRDQEDSAVRRKFAALWSMFDELVDAEKAAEKYSSHVFTKGYERALRYMLQLEELRNG
jgi:hypothetical protein